jgi:hypothetical protein
MGMADQSERGSILLLLPALNMERTVARRGLGILECSI